MSGLPSGWLVVRKETVEHCEQWSMAFVTEPITVDVFWFFLNQHLNIKILLKLWEITHLWLTLQLF